MEKEKISNITWIMMGSLALAFDLIQAGIEIMNDFFALTFVLVPLSIIGWLVNLFISVFALLTLLLWFKLEGLKLLEKKNVISVSITSFIETVPMLNALPGWTILVLTKYLSEKSKTLPGANITPGVKTP
ncbi:MAG: hypothetical protein AB200_02310 [Parcubacteria bacterium C7867-005]|nr:MAG: hypothetical protein AB200_02310 [Parcubacteria bacterium C7867-005]